MYVNIGMMIRVSMMIRASIIDDFHCHKLAHAMLFYSRVSHHVCVMCFRRDQVRVVFQTCCCSCHNRHV